MSEPASADGPASVEVIEVTKSFASPRQRQVVAVDAVSLAFRRGEFFSLLGPSGCGKTTLLRMIAGLEIPTAGVIRIGGRDAALLAAHERPVNTVFQHYALFPHLTVAQNVAFGLRYARVPRAQWPARVAATLALVRLEGLEQRVPSQLSGGQKQRVALARALILEPMVLLLDEPLAALDQKLRKEMQVELKALQRKLGITFILVTHDQEEALTMSDRIAVMHHGRVEQVGPAVEVFERPGTEFVAEFMGAGNYFDDSAAHGAPARRFVVRPEKLRLLPQTPSDGTWRTTPVTVVDRIYQGIVTQWLARTPGGATITVIEQNDHASDAAALRADDRAFVAWRAQDEVTLRAESPAAPGATDKRSLRSLSVSSTLKPRH